MNFRLLQSITKMLSVQNDCGANAYGWVWERWGKASVTELAQMQAGWQRNHPELFRAHGVYVL